MAHCSVQSNYGRVCVLEQATVSTMIVNGNLTSCDAQREDVMQNPLNTGLPTSFTSIPKKYNAYCIFFHYVHRMIHECEGSGLDGILVHYIQFAGASNWAILTWLCVER